MGQEIHPQPETHLLGRAQGQVAGGACERGLALLSEKHQDRYCPEQSHVPLRDGHIDHPLQNKRSQQHEKAAGSDAEEACDVPPQERPNAPGEPAQFAGKQPREKMPLVRENGQAPPA